MTPPLHRHIPLRAGCAIPLRAGCAVGALLVAGSAAADITAQEVRDRFVADYERMGMAVEIGSEESSGGILTLGDVALSFTFTVEGVDPDGELPAPPEPDREVRVEATFPEIAFEEGSEGDVEATLAPEGRMTVTSAEVGSEVENTASFALRSEGLALTIAEETVPGTEGADGGEGVERRYALDADRLALELEELVVEGETADAEALATIEAVSGTTVISPGAGPDGVGVLYAQTGEIGAITTRLDLPFGGSDPDSAPGSDSEADGPAEPAGRFVALSEIEGVSAQGESLLADAEVFERINALTPEDDPSIVFESVDGEATITAGPGRTEYVVASPEGAGSSFSIVSEGASSATTITTGDEGVGVSGRARAIRYTLEGDDMPVPRIELALEEGDAGFRFPVLEGEAPFELRYALSGLTLNEEVWALFDPEAQLPRDPASFVLGISGRMRSLVDLLDEESLAEFEEAEEMPFELQEAGIELRLEAVGADVEADGAFTFDPEGVPLAPGLPTPTGTLDVVATGIDGLFDTLSEMGLVAPDQLLPARMMLGLFARPDGSGGYTSEIEVDGATGGVTANGQRLR